MPSLFPPTSKIELTLSLSVSPPTEGPDFIPIAISSCPKSLTVISPELNNSAETTESPGSGSGSITFTVLVAVEVLPAASVAE